MLTITLRYISMFGAHIINKRALNSTLFDSHGLFLAKISIAEVFCTTLNFTAHPATSSFAVPYKTYSFKPPHENLKFTFIATGANACDSFTPERMLLLQHAANNSMPNRWGSPGGACVKQDPSIFYSAVRELWEEAGLIANSVGPQVGDRYLYAARTG